MFVRSFNPKCILDSRFGHFLKSFAEVYVMLNTMYLTVYYILDVISA